MAQNKKRPFPAAAGILVILAALLVLVGIIMWMKWNGKEADAEDAVLRLNNEDISAEEYRMLAEAFSNKVYMQYPTETVNQKNFWEMEIDGVIPWKQLDELVTDELKYNYTLKQYAVELGITDPYTYEELLENQEKENQSRADASESGKEVIYGLKEYDDQSYYQYWYSSLETQVINALINEYINVTEKECKAYYEENKDEYTYETGAEVLYAEIADTGVNPIYAEAMASSVAESMKEGLPVSELAEQYPEATVRELELNSFDTGEEKNGMYAVRWEIASQMAVGEIYGPYEEGDMLCVLKCTGKTEDAVLDYDDVKEKIERNLQIRKAEELIKEKEENMEIMTGNISAENVICNIQ